MANKQFKLFCKDLDEIVSIRTFDHGKEAKLYDTFKTYLAEVPPSFSVKTYKKKLVDTLLVDASSYYTCVEIELMSKAGLDVDENLKEEIIEALYGTVIEAYPHFEFEFICNDINNGIAFEHMRSLFKEHILTQEQPQYKKSKNLRSLGDIEKLKRKLNRAIVGQEEACEKSIGALKLILANLAQFSSFFYIGPTGVGKTKLAKEIGKGYSGRFFKVNCGEYSAPHDYAKLIGAPPGYVGHSDSSLLGEKAAESNAWVILFDEIEKANSKFFDFLLSLLDDGTCTDNMGNVLDFSQSLFVFTTNEGMTNAKIGSRRVGFDKEGIKYEDNRDQIMESIKKKFNPEFLNRVDHFIFFNQLKEQELKKVVRLEMRHLPIKINAPLVNYIIKNSNHQEYGARNISKFIKNNISTILADAVLRKQVPVDNGELYIFKVRNGELVIENIEEEKNGLGT